MSTLAGFSESAAAPSGFVGARWPWPSLSSIEIQSSSNFKYVVGPGRVDYPSNLKSRLHRISLVYHPSAWSSIENQSSSNFARGPAIIHRSLVVIRRLVPESIIHRNPVAIELGSATEAIRYHPDRVYHPSKSSPPVMDSLGSSGRVYQIQASSSSGRRPRPSLVHRNPLSRHRIWVGPGRLHHHPSNPSQRNSLSNSPCPLGRARGRGLI